MRYKNITLYREKSYENRDNTKPSIEDNINILTDEQSDKVVKYLESGYLLLSFVSPTTDPYDQKTSIPWAIYTDGIYIWDTIIIHWVKCYKVRLPNEFLTHIHEMGGLVNDIENLKELGGITEMMKNSETLWINE